MQRKRGGFTLLEVVIIIAIMGILSAIAMPSLKTVGPKQKFFKNQVMSMLRYARQSAMVRPVLSTSDDWFVQVYFNGTVTPAQFEIYSCSAVTNIGGDTATMPNSGNPTCSPMYNFFDIKGTPTSTPLKNILQVPRGSAVTVASNSNTISFDRYGNAYDNTIVSSPQTSPKRNAISLAVGSSEIIYTFDAASTVRIVPSTGYIYAP